MNRVVFLQPIGAAAADLPSPPASADAQAPASAPTTPAATTNVNLNVNVAGSSATQEICESETRQAFTSAGAYALGAVVVGLVVYGVLYRRLAAGGEFNRKVVGMLVAGAVGFGLAYADPTRTDQFKLCLNDPQMLAYMFLPNQEVVRALALGFGPALIVTLLGTFVVQKLLAR